MCDKKSEKDVVKSKRPKTAGIDPNRPPIKPPKKNK